MSIKRVYEKSAELVKCTILVGSYSRPVAVFVATREGSITGSFLPHMPRRLSSYEYVSEFCGFARYAFTFFEKDVIDLKPDSFIRDVGLAELF